MSGISQNAILQQFDFQPIQNILNQSIKNETISFEELVRNLIKGEIKYNSDQIINTILHTFASEMMENKVLLVSIFVIGIFSAILKSLCNAFENHQIADTGYYSMYLLLSALLMRSFTIGGEIADQTVQNLTQFMNALLPAFMLSVGMSSGTAGATGFYGAALLMITIILRLILQLVLPLIKIYVILSLVNHMSGGEYFRQLTELLKDFVYFLLKSMMGLAVGLNLIQGMISPVIDSVKRGAVAKAFSMIPGIGGATNSVLETVLGASILVKNSIGVAGILLLVIICLRPAAQLFIFYLMYQLTAVILSPIAHQDMTESISQVGEAAKMLLRTVLTSLMLFIITIAIAIISTT